MPPSALLRPLAMVVAIVLIPVSSLADPFFDVTTPALADSFTGYGAAWGDYDNDGDLDLYFANLDGPNRLFRNDAGLLTPVFAGPIGDGGAGTGVSWADYDNDGDLDMYLSKFGPNKLFRNDGGSFTNVASSLPLANSDSGGGVAWCDYDHDGDLDLYVANFGQPNVLLANDGNGNFSDVTPTTMANPDVGEGVAWADYDNDGDMDLYLANRGQPNKLYRNDTGGVFTDVTQGILGDPSKSQGVAWGDYDNDGDMDLYIGNSNQPNHLLRNEGDGSFTDVTTPPVDDPLNSHGVAWLDYDNDGDLDLCVANDGQANKIYRNDGGDSFTELSSAPFAANTFSKGLACGDYDNDGDVDLFFVNIGPNLLIRNDAPDSNGNHYLQIDLEGVHANRRGLGSRVRVVTGTLSQIREVTAGSGYLSHHSLTADFGLGINDVADSVIVQWPGGAAQVQVNVAADQRILITEAPAPTATTHLTSGIRLYAAHPNPFNPSTTISFELGRASQVRLEIFDLAGRHVRTLVREKREPGNYAETWRGLDDRGRSVSSGVYTCRLDTENGREYRRLTLVR